MSDVDGVGCAERGARAGEVVDLTVDGDDLIWAETVEEVLDYLYGSHGGGLSCHPKSPEGLLPRG